MTRRFYVASNRMTNGEAERYGWMKLKGEAIAEGKKRLAEHPELDKVYIVEVVTVIEREEPPFVVSEVRK